MLIDCDTCSVRGAACAGCAVTALLDTPDEIVNLGAAELHVIEVLARAGLSATVLAGSVEAEPAVPVQPVPVQPVPVRLIRRGDRGPAGWEGAA
jgi:hypothetical protein